MLSCTSNYIATAFKGNSLESNYKAERFLLNKPGKDIMTRSVSSVYLGKLQNKQINQSEERSKTTSYIN